MRKKSHCHTKKLCQALISKEEPHHHHWGVIIVPHTIPERNDNLGMMVDNVVNKVKLSMMMSKIVSLSYRVYSNKIVYKTTY